MGCWGGGGFINKKNKVGHGVLMAMMPAENWEKNNKKTTTYEKKKKGRKEEKREEKRRKRE